jgi:hypothetical protein
MQTRLAVGLTPRHGVMLLHTPINRGLSRYAAEVRPTTLALGTNAIDPAHVRMRTYNVERRDFAGS